MSQKKRNSRKQDNKIHGISAKDLSVELIGKLKEAKAAWWLLDMPKRSRSINSMAQMCWHAGVQIVGQEVIADVGDPDTLTIDAMKSYNEKIILAGIEDLLVYICKELMPRARQFALLNESYENTPEGSEKAANESGFVLFPPPITTRLCAKHNEELLDLSHRCEAMLGVPTNIQTVQMVSIITGLSIIDSHIVSSIQRNFDNVLKRENSTIEEIGEILLSISIPVLKNRLMNGMRFH